MMAVMSDGTDEKAANKELVIRYMTRAQANDIEGADECLAEDCVRMGPRPSAGVIEGHPHVDLYQPGTLTMEVENLIAEGPFVAAQIAVQATAAGGDPYQNYYHQLFECHDGQITAQWEYLDTLYASRVLNRSL